MEAYDLARCAVFVCDGTRLCSRGSFTMRYGKPYCWQHDPDRIKASRAPAVEWIGPGLSRDTAINLVESAYSIAQGFGGVADWNALNDAIKAAKRELGI